jgi:GntR family transcriptional regulator
MNDPFIISVNYDSTVPVYRQVADSIRSLLVEGVLKPGNLLPPVRELGLEMGVHFNTIAEAYRLLEGEGWLTLQRGRGKGALIRKRSEPEPGPETETDFFRGLRQLIAQARADGLSIRVIQNELKRFHMELSL